jgi:DNA-binding NtrC family response regulator/Tfp pilus assembly protein PilF
LESTERNRIRDLERKLTAAPAADPSGDRLADLQALVDLYLHSDSYVPALDQVDRMLALPELADAAHPSRLALESKAVECLRAQGRFAEAAERGLAALASAPSDASLSLRARLQLEVVDAFTKQSRYDEARALAQRALGWARETGDTGLVAFAVSRAGNLALRVGEWTQARDLFEEARALYQSLGDESNVADMQANLGIVHKNLCEWAIAVHHLREALHRDRKLGAYAKVANRLQNLGVVYLKSGEWGRAHDAFVEARQINRQVGNQWGITVTALALGTHARLIGRLDDAEKLLREALERALGAGQLREEALAREFLGDCAQDRGEWRLALDHYVSALQLAERIAPVGDVASEVLRRIAEAHLALREVEAASRAVERCRQVCDLLDDRYEGAVLQRVIGSLRHAAGDLEGAVQAWNAAVNLLGEMGERHERGRALFLLAQHVTDPTEARKYAYRASACFAEVGAEQRLAAVESWLHDRLPAPAAHSAGESRRPRLSSRRLAESIGVVGVSRGMARVLDLVERASVTDLTVVLVGQTGTGKELLARAIHDQSPRAGKPFLPVNCGSLRAELALSQLFGHRRGAFTGAHAEGVGLVEAAHTGTLFLDEVGELPLDVQVTLLRFLESGDYLRLGETTLRRSDVRVIGATHVDLRRGVAEGCFRADLFYRLHEIEIGIPSLAERIEDVLPLAHHFLRIYGGAAVPALSADASAALTAYPWPGNVRELENCIKRVLALGDLGETISAEDLEPHLARLPVEWLGDRRPAPPDERGTVLSVLDQARGNKSRAANLLGVSRKTLYARMRRLGIPLEDSGDDE